MIGRSAAFFIGWNMKTGIITYKMSLRPFMKPVLIIAAIFHMDWLANLCFKKELVLEGEEVEISS